MTMMVADNNIENDSAGSSKTEQITEADLMMMKKKMVKGQRLASSVSTLWIEALFGLPGESLAAAECVSRHSLQYMP